MKKFKIFLVMMLGIIAMVNQSCEKDDSKPVIVLSHYDSLLLAMDNDIKVFAETLQGNLYTVQVDTIWPLGMDGLPIKEKIPGTDQWIIIDTVHYTLTYAEAERRVKIFAGEQTIPLGEKMWQWKNNHTTDKVSINEIPYEDCVIITEEINGSSCQKDLIKLNNLGQLLHDNPNKNAEQIIRETCESISVKLQTASKNHLEKIVIESK